MDRMICEKIEECKEESNNLKKTLKDKKKGSCNSKYLIENKSKSTYYVIDFENCVYKKGGKDTKCDFGILTYNSIYYIELKGSDVKKGIKQLLATIKETGKCFNDLSKKARLIVSRFGIPNLRSREYKELAKITGSKVVIKQNTYTENNIKTS